MGERPNDRLSRRDLLRRISQTLVGWALAGVVLPHSARRSPGNGDTLTFRATGLPAGLVLNGRTGVIAGFISGPGGDW